MDIVREPKKKTGRNIWIAVGVLAVIAVTLWLRRLEPAAPTVDGAIIWTDTVKRGDMLRQVRGTGNLRPKNILLITATTGGKVEEIFAEPGLEVEPETVLLILSNPDVELDALQAQQQLVAAEANFENLRGNLETGLLNQQVTVSIVNNRLRDAQRTLDSFNEVREEVSLLDLQRTQDEVEVLTSQLEIENRTQELMTLSMGRTMNAEQERVERLRDLAEFQQNRVNALHVRAGSNGILRELQPEKGQWIPAGQTLGVIIQPGALEAVVGIPEVQAKDVLVGQEATVDTRSAGGRAVPSRVSRINPSASGGLVTVDIEILGDLPRGALADQSVEGIITLERLENVLHMNRPTVGQANSSVGMFKVVDDGQYAVRITVQIGQTSVNSVEITGGLEEGDVVILSDMARWDEFDRVRIRR
ncbi:efflux RND transporter periplasmic adaptor subunit [Candidatus Zixiibacteriota bacterium]